MKGVPCRSGSLCQRQFTVLRHGFHAIAGFNGQAERKPFTSRLSNPSVFNPSLISVTQSSTPKPPSSQATQPLKSRPFLPDSVGKIRSVQSHLMANHESNIDFGNRGATVGHLSKDHRSILKNKLKAFAQLHPRSIFHQTMAALGLIKPEETFIDINSKTVDTKTLEKTTISWLPQIQQFTKRYSDLARLSIETFSASGTGDELRALVFQFPINVLDSESI